MLARPLRRAIHLLQDNSAQLTVAHPLLLKVLLKLQLYEYGRSVLSRPVVEVNPDAPVTAEEVLLFLNYGARIYIGLEKWRDALDFTKMVRVGIVFPCDVKRLPRQILLGNGLFGIPLVQCVAVRGTTLSAIQVDSYKKYILVSLLHQGPPVRDPISATSTVGVALKSVRCFLDN